MLQALKRRHFAVAPTAALYVLIELTKMHAVVCVECVAAALQAPLKSSREYVRHCRPIRL